MIPMDTLKEKNNWLIASREICKNRVTVSPFTSGVRYTFRHQVPIIKGDAKSISIGAASIIAKVTRDRLMVEYDKVLPGYDFASNKGYGTKKHIEGLKELGPSPIHRRTFIKKYI